MYLEELETRGYVNHLLLQLAILLGQTFIVVLGNRFRKK
jgi:hypothetical protein